MINRCICHKIDFVDILKLADLASITRLPELRDRYNICNKCKRCNPYVRDVLKHRVTEFPSKYNPKHD